MPIRRVKVTFKFLKAVYERWNEDNCFILAASLSYYTLFSIPAMLVIVITVASSLYGQEAVQGELFGRIESFIGTDGAEVIQELVENTYLSGKTIWARTVGIITLLVTSTLAFGVLQNSLNIIWRVKPKPEKSIILFIIVKLLSFGLVLVIALLIVVLLIANTVIILLEEYISQILGSFTFYFIEAAQLLVSFGTLILLFGIIFKVLPDIRIRWRAVWTGAIFTAVLFSLGKYLIGLYLGSTPIISTYGAAGSLIVVILWVNYSAWIFFFGAEFTYVYADWRNEPIASNRYAVRYLHQDVEIADSEMRKIEHQNSKEKKLSIFRKGLNRLKSSKN